MPFSTIQNKKASALLLNAYSHMHKETMLFGFNRNCRTFQSPFSAHFLSLYVQAKSKIYFLNSEIEKTISAGVSVEYVGNLLSFNSIKAISISKLIYLEINF